MVALCNRCGHYIFALWFLSSFFFFFSFLAESQRSEIGCLPYFNTWCGLSVNLECMSEMCCTQLAENTERKKVAKNRHLGTIAQLCRAISSQLRHISTIGKNLLNSNTSSTCPHNMVNFGPLAAEIGLVVWSTPANFNGFCVLAVLVVGVSQTLRCWTEDMNKTKVMISGERQKPVQKAARWPCGVCGRGVGSNSVQCTNCHKWVHKKCSSIKGSMYQVMRSFICGGCSNPVISTGHTGVDIGASANVEIVDKFCYLGGMLRIRSVAHAAGFAAARRCLQFLVLS